MKFSNLQKVLMN